MQALLAANDVSFGGDDELGANSDDEGVALKHTLRRKSKKRKAAESWESMKLADGAIARVSDVEGNEGACESKETVPSFGHKREAEAIAGSSDSSSGSGSDNEELSDEGEDSIDQDGEKRIDQSTAFGRAFRKIMKKKLPSSDLSEAMVTSFYSSSNLKRGLFVAIKNLKP
ncbi:hypothetical protein GOP47_0008780 [Adiantum capillus-veneris]|uniref:Uncharacterized protein n=1 Tax=Adiantum capillus-veneris TaxID=13818 RepID=A0A9D4UZM0_ADICA|nr:hypothetical protein GOP47_0008780 [Adiantum capillus-veneris]